MLHLSEGNVITVMRSSVMHYLINDGLKYKTPCGLGSPQSFDATTSKRGVTCAKCREALKLARPDPPVTGTPPLAEKIDR
jgi:hypothetical protein